jgi:hypothetical protein
LHSLTKYKQAGKTTHIIERGWNVFPFLCFWRAMKKETKYQAALVKKINTLFPGCVVLKNDPSQRQGIPDIIILYKNRWAALEVKTAESSPVRPNQPYYVEKFGEMSYASFVYPENEERVLSELQRSFTSSR